ncbi:MAG: hypothetical protein ACFFC6_06270 [Promethearchaeota archaeon]
MKRINKLGLVLSVSFLLLLTAPIPVNAQSRDFEEGDMLTFGYQETYKRIIEVGGGKENGEYELDQANVNIEIEDIDSEEVEYTYWDRYGSSDKSTVRYDSDISEFVMLFRPNYVSDDGDAVLSSISGPMDMIGGFFIDPEWDTINENFADSLNDWETTVAGSTIDMDDFVSDADTFTLMGKDNLDDGLDAFTDTTRKWSGKIVFTDNIVYWDNNDGEWRDLESYEIEWSAEYTEGGTLAKASQTKRYANSKWSVENSEFLQNKAVSLGAAGGGLIPGVTHAFELPIMILAVISSTIALRFVGKRRS